MIDGIEDLIVNQDHWEDGRPLDLGKGRHLYVRPLSGQCRHVLDGRRRIEALLTGDEHHDELLICAYVLIADWSGFTRDGVVVEYDPKLGVQLLEAAPWIVDRVMDMSRDLRGYRLDADIKSAT